MTPRDIISGKAPLPTALNSAQVRARIGADIRRRSVFSARMAERAWLDLLKEELAAVAEGKADRDAEEALRAWLEESGYVPPDGEAGSVTDHASHARIDLIIRTNEEMAAGAAMAADQPAAVLDAYPAWELIRLGYTRAPRDWDARWRLAGEACGWRDAAREQFAARKDSPIWRALGDGAGGYTDTLGNPFPPFAFNSRMAWVALSREEAGALGITGSPSPAGATLSPGERDLAAALAAGGPDFAASLAAELEAL
jgi:hypothetical protein